MKAIVTGASGFVGSHLTERLLADGHDVLGMDVGLGPNLAAVEGHPRLSFAQGDIRDAGYVARHLGADAGVVFHLAAMVGVTNYLQSPLEVLDVNVMGTRNVLEAASDHDTRVVLASTSEVYGRNPKVPWSEDDDRVLGSTSVDRWSYSTSKATCEHIALAVHRHRGTPVTIVRYFNVYGPRQSPIYVVSRAIHRALNGEPPILYDGGAQTRCFTYVSDAVAGTVAASSRDTAIGEVFNLGNPAERTILEATEIVLELSGTGLGWTGLDTAQEFGDSYQDIIRRVPDVSKAKRMLDWSAATSLEEGVAMTIEWARDHPEWLGGATAASAPTSTESSP